MMPSDESLTRDPTMQLLHRLRDEGGRPVDVGGDKPIPLDDPDRVLVVSSGRVDVFSVRADGGQTMGARHHICRIEIGAALFGMDVGPDADGFEMVAVGAVDTSLVELRRSRLVGLLNDPEYADSVTALLEGWVHRLSVATAAGILVPKQTKTVAPGQEIAPGRFRDDTSRQRHRVGPSSGRELRASSAIRV